MKQIKLIVTIISAFPFMLSAQGPGGPPPTDPLTTLLDKNEDGKLSAGEIKRAPKALLKLDENDDDSISSDELKPEEPKKSRRQRRKERDGEGQQPRPPQPQKSPLMEALDTNEDGELSKEEIANAIKSLTALDKDRDGKLSQEESGLDSKKDLQRSRPPQGGPSAEWTRRDLRRVEKDPLGAKTFAFDAPLDRFNVI
jgi:hypothetical protein